MLGRPSLYHSPAMEALKWASIFALACALVLQLAKRLGGTEPPVLPSEFKSRVVPVEHWTEELRGQDYNLDRFWHALKLHEQNKPTEAIEAWKRTVVGAELLEWKLVAMGSASFQTMQLDDAERYLNAALELGPLNPIAQYQLALVYLSKASTWDDQTEPPIRLVSTAHEPSPTQRRFLFRMAAMMELERAIQSSHDYDMHASLLPQLVCDVTDENCKPAPTITEFAKAIGAENFRGKAFGLLGTLELENGQLEDSELNLDEAARLGIDVQKTYEKIAVSYEDTGDYTNAARLYLKSAAHGNRLAGPLSKAIESLAKAW